MAIKLWAGKNILDHLTRVPIPNVIFPRHPLRTAGHFGEGTIVFETGILPRNAAELDCVDLLVKILVVGDGWGVIVGDERGGPQFEELINLSL